MNQPLPLLITFDGEARSGKGTIVHFTKDYLRDTHGKQVMLIDAGQVFRVLVVAAMRAGVNLDSPAAIDNFLADDAQAEASVQLVKEVYHMEKAKRDSLLYASEIGVASAKVGARPLSQSFKDELLKKWLHDAAAEGVEIVLLDGRALELAGTMLEKEGLCNFVMGFYFICDAQVGARRTLGFASTPYNELDDTQRVAVDELVEQIISRNQADKTRAVQPITPPVTDTTWHLPDLPRELSATPRPMLLIDTTADLTKEAMALPVAELVARLIA